MVVVPQAYFYRRWRDPTQTPPPTHCPVRRAGFRTKIHNLVLPQVKPIVLMHLHILSDNTTFMQKKDLLYTNGLLKATGSHIHPSTDRFSPQTDIKISYTQTDANNKEDLERQKSACVLCFCGDSLCEIVLSSAKAPWLYLYATVSSHSFQWPRGTK